MLPYFPPPAPIALFGLRIPVFGLFLLASVLTAYLVLVRRGRALALASPSAVERFAQVVILSAIAGAHVAGVLADAGPTALVQPSLFFSAATSLSSAGGFLAAAAAGSLFVHIARLDARSFADLAAHAFPFAWLIARAGCAAVHDHPGRLSASPLAVRFPGGPRLDCGLLECLATVLLVVLVIAIERRARPAGLLAGCVAMAYAAIRFPLDFFRAADLPGSDARHSGLTVAQWGVVALFAMGVYSTSTVAKKARSPAPVP